MIHWAKALYRSKRKFSFYKKKISNQKTSEQTRPCSVSVESLESDRVFEDNHLKGKVRGFAHKYSKVSCKTASFTPIVFLNGSK